MSKWRRIVPVGDLHIGSVYAPWLPSYETDQSIKICASKHQLQLFQYWWDFCSGPAKEADTLILMGDLCQGNNRIESGRTTTTTELEHQVEVAVQFLNKFANGKEIIGVSGSRYHNALDVSLDRQVIKELGGKYLGKLGNVKITGPDRILQISHGAGGGTIYPGTGASQFSLFLDAAEGRGTIPFHIDCVIQAHLHHYIQVEDRGRTFVRIPAWETWYSGYDPMVKNYGRMQPDIGGIVIDIGPDQIVIKKYIYPAVQVDGNLVEI